jgi:Electron transfer DM13
MRKLVLFAIMGILTMSSCSDDSQTITIDTSKPDGTFTASKSGTFVEQNSTGSAGTVEIGVDSKGTQFLKFGNDFTTNLGTGTVTVYLSTSMDYVADPGSGNPDLRLVGIVSHAGETFYKLDPAAESKFTHVILWCGSANIPFGYAAVQ